MEAAMEAVTSILLPSAMMLPAAKLSAATAVITAMLDPSAMLDPLSMHSPTAAAVAPTEAFAAVAAAPPRQPSARRLHLAMRLRRP